ncbi:hypothetical protein [Aquamicrobium soli]|uniref:Uncharacterized protein n=1 Tax=Aquamicrobium soli TaxID=1811518 RepID=A0ABV7KI78_9HYPH
MTRLMMDEPKPMSAELAALLEKAKNHVMTKPEREAQRRSWVVGEMMLSHPEMSREEANRIYDEVC